MNFGKCIKCLSLEYTVKTISIKKEDDFSIIGFSKSTIYYAKTCSNCGYTEFYDAKIIDRQMKKLLKGNKKS